MTDFPQSGTLPLFICNGSYPFFNGGEINRQSPGSVAGTSTSWSTSNRALFYPFTLPWAYPVRRVFFVNGSAAAGNTDVGIYTSSYRLIYSTGSTAQTVASDVQYVTPATMFWLPAGRYFLGVNNDGTTNRMWATTSNVGYMNVAGVLRQTVAFPLPDPMVPVAIISDNVTAYAGFTRTATGY